VCHLRAFGLNENLSARIKLYCIQNYSNYLTNNYGRRSCSSASGFFFLGVSKWGKHFIMRFLRHLGLSALQFPLPVFFGFCFLFFFLCFVCPSAVALFSPVANSFFPLKLHSPCFFPVCGQRTGGVKVESLPKTPTKTATKLGNP